MSDFLSRVRLAWRILRSPSPTATQSPSWWTTPSTTTTGATTVRVIYKPYR